MASGEKRSKETTCRIVATEFKSLEKNIIKKRAIKIVESFVGRDVDAISVLGYAAERGKFKEYAEKLEQHYEENMKYVHPEARRISQIPGAVRAERFFLNCYHEMGIKPSNN